MLEEIAKLWEDLQLPGARTCHAGIVRILSCSMYSFNHLLRTNRKPLGFASAKSLCISIIYTYIDLSHCILHIDTVALSKAGSRLMHSAATATLPPCKAPQMRSRPQPFGCNNCARTPCRVVAPKRLVHLFQDLNHARSVFQELA